MSDTPETLAKLGPPFLSFFPLLLSDFLLSRPPPPKRTSEQDILLRYLPQYSMYCTYTHPFSPYCVTWPRQAALALRM